MKTEATENSKASHGHAGGEVLRRLRRAGPAGAQRPDQREPHRSFSRPDSPAGQARRGPNRISAFTIIELLAVIGVLAVLIVMLLPMLTQGREAGRSVVCQSNLRQMQLAYAAYLMDHKGMFFPFRENTAEGTLWYFGLEKGSGSEGSRKIDMTKARLAPYFEQSGGIAVCPSLATRSRHFKQKFSMATYGYGLNIFMLLGTPQQKKAGVSTFEEVEDPSETITWADCAQINTWQPPASPGNPMLEEWYWLAPCIPGAPAPPPFHFRHGGILNAAFADGSVRTFLPDKTDPRCDGLTGYIEPCGEDAWLRPLKTR